MTSTRWQHTRKDIAELLAPAAGTGGWKRIVRWLLSLGVITGLIVVGTTALRSNRTSDVPAYVTELVTRGDLEVHVSATGTLQPTNTVEIGSELSGTIDAVFVDENDAVKKGHVLAQLDTSRLRDQIARSQAVLASAEARLAQANATIKEAMANLERLREVWRLSDGRVPSKTEMESAEATLARAEGERASAEATVTEAHATLSSDRTNLAKASIRSPINGIVLARAVEPGQTVAASLQVATLFTIAEDLRQMELEVDVDEADVGRVKDGQQATFTVDAYPNRTYTASVTRVAYGSTTTGDVVSYTAMLRVRNDDLSLRPGMTASAGIESASVEQALLVPNAALRFTPTAAPAQGSGRGFVSSLMPGPPRSGNRQAEAMPEESTSQVWVLRDGVAAAVPVEVGETNGRYTQVTSGDLTEDTQVITDIAGAQS